MIYRFLSFAKWKWYHYKDNWLDRKYGINTSGNVRLSELQISSENICYGVHYEPVQIHIFQNIIKYLPNDRINFKFIDLGSGKGRAVILAALAGYKHCVGVDFATDLCVIAQKNKDIMNGIISPNTKIEIYCHDATEYIFPSEDIVIFLYNPFGEVVLRKVLSNINILHNDEHKIYIVYRNPVCADVFRREEWLEEIFRSEDFCIYTKHNNRG